MPYAAAFLALGPQSPQGRVRRARGLYGAQLAANFCWSLLFFRWQVRLTAFFWLVLLWWLIFWMIRRFSQADRLAARLQLPAAQLIRALEKRGEILAELKKYYSDVVLDLEARG